MDVEGGCFGKLSDYPLYVENQDKGNFDILLTTDWLDHPLIFFSTTRRPLALVLTVVRNFGASVRAARSRRWCSACRP